MPRLIDYLIVVGNRKPVLDVTEAPELLRCFPEEPHDDFPLPLDVVFFCQPEGCVSASKRLSLKDTNSFVFTLTEKDSGVVRYGICCNFFRPCIGLKAVNSVLGNDGSGAEMISHQGHISESDEPKQESCNYKPSSCRSLTSICIISEKPFLSTFRECLFVLRKIIETRHPDQGTLDRLVQEWNVVTEGKNVMKYVPNTTLKNWMMFLNPESFPDHPQIKEIYDIEDWMLRLLKVPVPVAGGIRIEVELLPRHIQPPLTFALPEKSRFSLLDFPLHLPLELLGVDTCLKVLTCILLENKVLLQSDDYNALSISVMALTSMLYPLEYMFPVIPLLPTCMKNAEQLLLAPTPYVIGVPSSFLQYKTQHFQVPSDILIIDLDSSKISVPLSMDEIPSLPEPEGSLLKEQLKQCIDCLSLYPHSLHDLEMFADNEPMLSRQSSVSGSKLSRIIYGNDIDSVDVAIRASLVKFFTSPNVVGDFVQHCRVLRLYPRPLVAFQRESFVISRQTTSDFVRQLAETQAVEYYAEWLVSPTDTVYRKVDNGIVDPRVIGDKPRWYSHYLEPNYYQVHNPHSKLGHDLLDDSDDSGPLYEDEDDFTDSDISIDDNEYFQLSTERTLSADMELTAKAREHISQFYDSSYSSYNTLDFEEQRNGIEEHKNIPNPALTAHTTVFKQRAHRQESQSPVLEGIPSPLLLKKVHEFDCDSEQKVTLSDDSASTKKPEAPSSSLGKIAKDVLSRQGSNASERINALIGQIKPRLSQKNSIESEVSVQSFVSSGSSECNGVQTPPMPQRASSFTVPMAEIEESSTFKPNSQERYFERSISNGQRTSKDPRIHNSENQQVINDVVAGVLKGDGVGWFSQKKLRRLLIHESLRQYLFKQLYEPKEQSDEDEALHDIYISKNVYRGIVELFRVIIEGYEHSAKQKGIGGIASFFVFLEVMHTHYCGKRIQDGGVSKGKKTEEKVKKRSESSRMSIAVDAKSDSSVVYTREATPIEATDHRLSSIFTHNGDHNDNLITKVNGVREHHLGKRGSMESSQNSSTTSQDRDSVDASFEESEIAMRKLSMERRASSHNSSLEEDRTNLGTIKRLPSLSHSGLSSSSTLTGSTSAGDLSSVTTKDSLEDRNLVCKSNLCAGYRFRNGKLHETRKERVGKGISGNGRRFVFEGLLNPRSSIWYNMDLWESCFYDSVAAEREIVGMDIGPTELLERYRSLGSAERRCLEEDEDRILAAILHNMVAYMVMVEVDKTQIKKKIRRLLGKAHIGLNHTQTINALLDHLDKLNGNDIDLKPMKSRTMKKHVFVVHLGDDQSGPVFFLEICDDCMLMKSTNGGIIERWWYENLVNMSCSPRAKVLCLWIKTGEETQLQKISTKKCKALYSSIKESMEKTARKFKNLDRGMELGGEFDVMDIHSKEKGLLRVSLDGISIIFVDRKCAIDVRNLKNCSRKDSILYIEEFVPHTQNITEHKFFSRKAGNICYSVLCLFSYLAAASNGSAKEPRSSDGSSSVEAIVN